MRRPIRLAALAALFACALASAQPVAEIAPTGKLRAAINFGNPILADKGASGAAARRVGGSRASSARIGVPVELVTFDSAGKVSSSVAQWDIAFLAVDPARASDIAFTAPYVMIEGAYLVPASSPIKSNDGVDRAGTRVVVGAGSAYDLFLTREMKAATLVRAPTSPAVVDMCRAELDVPRRQAAARGRRRVPGALLEALHGDQPGDGLPQGRRCAYSRSSRT